MISAGMLSALVTFRDVQPEPWCKIQYSVENIDEYLMMRLRKTSATDPSLKLPSNNQYIARKFDLCAECDEKFLNMTVPICITQEDRMKFWFKSDNTFRVPHASVYVRIYFKAACHDARGCALYGLFIEFLKDELSEIMFEVKIVMIKIAISFVDGVFELKGHWFQ